MIFIISLCAPTIWYVCSNSSRISWATFFACAIALLSFKVLHWLRLTYRVVFVAVYYNNIWKAQNFPFVSPLPGLLREYWRQLANSFLSSCFTKMEQNTTKHSSSTLTTKLIPLSSLSKACHTTPVLGLFTCLAQIWQVDTSVETSRELTIWDSRHWQPPLLTFSSGTGMIYALHGAGWLSQPSRRCTQISIGSSGEPMEWGSKTWLMKISTRTISRCWRLVLQFGVFILLIWIQYPDAPNSWYFTVFLLSFIVALVVIYMTDSTLPWWVVLIGNITYAHN